MQPLSATAAQQREDARKVLLFIAQGERVDIEQRVAAAATLLQDLAIQEHA